MHSLRCVLLCLILSKFCIFYSVFWASDTCIFSIDFIQQSLLVLWSMTNWFRYLGGRICPRTSKHSIVTSFRSPHFLLSFRLFMLEMCVKENNFTLWLVQCVIYEYHIWYSFCCIIDFIAHINFVVISFNILIFFED